MPLTLITSALLALGACIPEPPDNDEIVGYASDTAMGAIQEAGVLRVAIEQHPPFSSFDAGSAQGFVVDYANDIAGALGIEAEFELARRDELARLVKGTAPRADVVFPLIPITEKIARANAVTDPYWVGHQRLLVSEPVASRLEACAVPGENVLDIGGMTPDEVGAEALGDDGAEEAGEFRIVAEGRRECLRLFSSESPPVVTGPDIELLRLMQRAPGALVGDQLTTEGYTAFVRNDLPRLADFVNTQLAEAKAEGRWTAWYARWIGPHVTEPAPRPPPEMTAEEAAALYPAELD